MSLSSSKHLALFLALLRAAKAVDTNTVSITALADFTVEQSCVQNCLYLPGQYNLGYNLQSDLGCAVDSTVYNACYCAISIYDEYCTEAGYPRTNGAVVVTASSNPGAATALSSAAGGAQTTIAAASTSSAGGSSDSGITVITGLSTTITITTGAVYVPEATGTSSPSSSGSSSPPIGAIVGGVVGGLALLGILGILFFCWMRQRNRKAKLAQAPAQQQQQFPYMQQQPPPQQQSQYPPPQYTQPQPQPQNLQPTQTPAPAPPTPVSPMSSFAVPAAAMTKIPVGGGRAELQDPNAQALTPNTEVEANERRAAETTEGRYGLRPEELDSSGRYAGELHGDGRQGVNHAELPGM
ncbi:hypothetical protein G7Y89_g4983 [Cudoniella acicularis]|uniref:Extracellular membrane protein CFEM domain-containing protein n=1 Tax=Cudoniella acicularis TaxID=354080 RepID=A0A8H4W6W9_9HELO|nr:hypothetical protein G7Y89_g4983 [Cudoniella acicularis]